MKKILLTLIISSFCIGICKASFHVEKSNNNHYSFDVTVTESTFVQDSLPTKKALSENTVDSTVKNKDPYYDNEVQFAIFLAVISILLRCTNRYLLLF